MTKKVLALLLALAMMIPMATALADAAPERPKVGNVYVDGLLPICDPGTVKLTIACTANGADMYAEDTYKKYWAAPLAEATGLEIEWVALSQGMAEKKAVWLASGEMPDVFAGSNWLNDNDILLNSTMFVQLDELLPKYGKNIMNALETITGDEWKKIMTYPDGHIYSIMGGEYADLAPYTNTTPFWNKEWLAAVNMEVPTTTDELYAVLKAFKEAKLGGENTIPMTFCESHWTSSISYFLGVYGITAGSGSMNSYLYTLGDGEIKFWADSQNLRDALDFIHQLISEGLLDAEGFTQNSEQWLSKIESNQAGSFLGYGTEIATEATWKKFFFTNNAITAPGYEDQFILSSGNAPRYVRNNWTITKSCKEPLAALMLYDYMSRDQYTDYELRYGKEGLIWELRDGVYTNVASFTYSRDSFTLEDLKKFYPEDEMPWLYEDSDNKSTIVNSQIFQDAPLRAAGLQRLPVELTDDYTPASLRTYVLDFYPRLDLVQKYMMPKPIVQAEYQEEFDFNTEGLISHVTNFIAHSALEGVTDEAWEAYVNALDNYGYKFYQEWYTNVYLKGNVDAMF